MKLTTYQTADMSVTPGKTWLAHMDLGSGLFMSFFGATEELALERANAWYEGERKKYDRKEGNGPIIGAETRVDGLINQQTFDNIVPSDNLEWSDSWAIPSEHRLTGSVWVLNRATGHRARIAADQLAEYEGNGYVRGGPRSK